MVGAHAFQVLLLIPTGFCEGVSRRATPLPAFSWTTGQMMVCYENRAIVHCRPKGGFFLWGNGVSG